MTGLAAAAGVLLVTAGYPLWVQFHGPLVEQGSPWKPGHFRNRPGDFVNGPSGVLLHSQATVVYLSQHAVRMVEYFAYLGWPMLVVLVLAAVCFWRDLRVRALAVAFVVLEVFSLGSRDRGGAGPAHPGHPDALALPPGAAVAEPESAEPVLAAGGRGGRGGPGVLPGPGVGTGCPGGGRGGGGCPGCSGRPGGGYPRCLGCPAADALAAAEAAAASEAAPAADRPPAPAPASAPAWRKAAAVALIALALVPIIPLPLQTAAVITAPAGWQQAFARLRLASDARVLVVPLQAATVMRWQADTGVPGSVIGGYCIAPTPGTGKAELCGSGRKPTADYLNDLWLGKPGAVAPSTAQLRSDLRYWRPAAIVAVTSRDSRLGRYLTNVFGPPALQAGSVLAWRPVRVPRAIGNRPGSPVNS